MVPVLSTAPAPACAQNDAPEPSSRRAHLSPKARFRVILGLIVAVAFALRLLAAVELADTPKVKAPSNVTDMATYRKLATAITAGRWPKRFYYQPFYYAVFLPCVLGLAGGSVWGAIIAQALLGAATVYLVGLLGARCFSARSGLLGAALLALSRYHIFYTPYLLMAVLIGFLITLLLYAAIRAYERNTWLWWACVALLAGVTAITRGNALLLVPGLLALMVWRNRRDKRALALKLLLFVVLAYAPQLPFALRNYSHYGRWTGPSSALDPVLALGNNPEAPAAGMCYTDTYEAWVKLADLSRQDRTPVLHQVWGWFSQEPGAYVELKFRMFLMFWNSIEVPNNVAFELDAAPSMVLNLPFLLGFSVLGSLGLAGALLAVRRSRRSAKRSLLLYALVAYCVGVVMFYVLARFRLPVVPLLAVFGGLAVDRLARVGLGLRRGRSVRLPLRRWVLAMAFAAVNVNWGVFLYSAYLEKYAVGIARPHGVAVVTAEKVAVYDHGPMVLGGWRPRPLLPGMSLRFRKSLVLDDRMPQALPPSAAFRVPISAPKGVMVAIRVKNGGEQVEVRSRARGQVGIEWIEVPLKEVAWVEQGDNVRTATFDVEVSAQGGGLLVYFDERRDYGRTSLLSAAGETQPAGRESGAELVFARRAVKPGR